MSWSSFFWIRSTGFPFKWVNLLGAFDKNERLNNLLNCREDIDSANKVLLDFISSNNLISSRKIKNKIEVNQPISLNDFSKSIQPIIKDMLLKRNILLDSFFDDFNLASNDYDNELNRIRQQLFSFLRNNMIREAIYLSNPEALKRIDSIVNDSNFKVNSRIRQRLRLAWNYLQRFCAKNDTASFFGPIAWGEFGDKNMTKMEVNFKNGNWLAKRKTSFEYWVIDRFSAAINQDPQLRQFLPIRINYGCYFYNEKLYFPINKSIAPSKLGNNILNLLSDNSKNELTYGQLINRFCDCDESKRNTKNTVDFLIEKGVIDLGIRIPPGINSPELKLISALDALPSSSHVSLWSDRINKLIELKNQFEAGDLPARIEVNSKFGSFFEKTNINTIRTQGKMYVGRFAVYEDCGRNLSIILGQEISISIKKDMEVIMNLYVWLANILSTYMQDQYYYIWSDMIKGDIEEVDFIHFLNQVQLTDCVECVVNSVKPIIEKAWKCLIKEESFENEYKLEKHDFVRLINLLCEYEPRSKFLQKNNSVFIHSPDFMISANTVEAIKKGNYEVILGEVHPAVHTVSQPVAYPFCHKPKEILKEVSDLLSNKTLVLADSPESYQRSHIDWLECSELWQVVLPGNVAKVPAERQIPAGRGKVVFEEGQLYFKDRKTGIVQDLLTLMPGDYHRACFSLAGDVTGNCLPYRLRYNNIIFKRYSWSIATDNLPKFKRPGESLDSYLDWQKWAKENKMPRYVFVKSPSETKPFYVDFKNPLAIDLLSSLDNRSEILRFSEMKPSPEELWLEDERGKYCCEFRTSVLLDKTSLLF